MFRLVFTSLIVFVGASWGAVAETPLERGNYLVNAVMACDGCHTPRGPPGPRPTSSAR